jgi:predicted signal transduction protein with EAL and GGDEF domain
MQMTVRTRRTMIIANVRLDREAFVMTMTQDPSNALIMRSVVDLGHNLGFKLVAEGVETEQILTALAGLGCDVAQGYHYSRPITAAAFDRWCEGQHRLAKSPAGFDTLTLTATKIEQTRSLASAVLRAPGSST